MRLTILGGAAASPNTGMGCSGYLLSDEAVSILIDPGPGTLLELRRHADFRTLDGVVVTHMHLDHVLDLLALRHALAYNPIPAPRPVPVWLPPGGASLLAAAVAPFDACDAPGRFSATVSVAEYDPSQALRIGGCRLTFAPVVHYLPTWAIRIESAAGTAIGYTADTGPAADLAGFFAGVDLLLAEATLLESSSGPAGKRGSLTAREAGALAAASGAKRLVLTHLWEERGFGKAQADAATAYPGRIDLARPGLTIEVER
jgi:ribonuclease BN (tRNA processing enzyme)